MEKVAILAITKNGVKIATSLKKFFPSWELFAPSKFSDNDPHVNWYSESTTVKIGHLFGGYEGLVCLFSLGAVIRLVSPNLKDKKTDPAVIVIDDKCQFVISALSGHLGGANKLTQEIAKKLDATPVITTAADVNKTIAVDLLGREFGWKIDDDSNVTKVSALMVNEEKIGVFQDSGEKNWWAGPLPKNVTIYSNLENLKNSESRGYLIISDKQITDTEILSKAVIYRPKTLVVGIGLHWDTTKETIKKGLDECLAKFQIAEKSIALFVSLKKPKPVKGLTDFAEELKIPLELFAREELASIEAPNPSKTVQSFEGTPSVSEAAALKGSGGRLVVDKQKFPPNLTIAIARIPN